MTVRDISVRAGYIVDQRRVVCDCGRVGGHDANCRLEQAWTRAMRQAQSQLRREEQSRRVMYAVAM